MVSRRWSIVTRSTPQEEATGAELGTLSCGALLKTNAPFSLTTPALATVRGFFVAGQWSSSNVGELAGNLIGEAIDAIPIGLICYNSDMSL
jgi:hypothetical protein